jgi:hypothetical protein
MPSSSSKSNSNLSTRFRKTVSDVSQTHGTKKRTYEESFGQRDYEVERYGQEIPPEFFKTNQGHGVKATTPSNRILKTTY